MFVFAGFFVDKVAKIQLRLTQKKRAALDKLPASSVL
jgi:hypothetical protein